MPRILTGAGILVALIAPVSALASDVTLTTDTVLSVNGVTLNVSGSSASVDSIVVNATNFVVAMSSGSSFKVTAPGLEKITSDTSSGLTGFVCDSSGSSITYTPTSAVTATIVPLSTLCSSTSDTSTGGSTSSTVVTSGSSSSSSSGSSAASATPAASVTQTTTTAATTAAATPATPAIPASGLSVSQVQSILDVLASFEVDAATMASVKAALEGTTTGSITSAAVHTFQANLTVGSLGSEVKALQQFLNAHGYPVASSGAGSPGNETTRFGAATKAALIKYQKAKGITPAAGYFGAKTRAAVNAE
ncbi:MAG: peptidoglycan-binding domain-containing protein [Candidatus Pacebacteria bacterium]|nr:peptidoglycan-binding domain-containing protein [Candidatus Paceibacterota bacterium]